MVTVDTSSATLSKSGGNPPFTITLNACVDSEQPITADTFRSVLQVSKSALDHQGLEFKDIETGKLAERPRMNVLVDRIPDMLSASTNTVVEIPPKDDALQPYTVSHTFHIPQPPPLTERAFMSVEEQIRTAYNQAAGFAVGHTYEIGLGIGMSSISWWKSGGYGDIFASGPWSAHSKAPKLSMMLTNVAKFEVVE